MSRKTIARRTAVVAVALALMSGACGAGDGAGQSDDAHTNHGAGDHAAIEIGEDVVAPRISIEVTEDPVEGWNLAVMLSDFRLAPENVSGPHVDGEGHMHLYIDGQKAARLYDTWYQLPPLEAGTHEVRVDLRSNDHALLTAEGKPIEAVATLEVSHEQATAHAVDGGSAQDAEAGGHTHDGTIGHGRANGAKLAADVADADQTVALQIVNGELVDGFRRVRVVVGSVVAWSVTADAADEIHIHGYDILQPVADGHPASFAFAAEIPGVFEVELEASGQLLLLLEVS